MQHMLVFQGITGNIKCLNHPKYTIYEKINSPLKKIAVVKTTADTYSSMHPNEHQRNKLSKDEVRRETWYKGCRLCQSFSMDSPHACYTNSLLPLFNGSHQFHQLTSLSSHKRIHLIISPYIYWANYCFLYFLGITVLSSNLTRPQLRSVQYQIPLEL